MADFLVILIVGLCLLGILCYHIRRKKKGDTGCGCGCSGCSGCSADCKGKNDV